MARPETHGTSNAFQAEAVGEVLQPWPPEKHLSPSVPTPEDRSDNRHPFAESSE